MRYVTMLQRDIIPARSGRDGFIIIAVLWMLIALATLASIYSVYIANTAMALSVSDDTLQAELLATTSLELTAYQFSASDTNGAKDANNATNANGANNANDAKGAKSSRPSRGGFRFRAGTANVGVTFISEAARIDLNMASKEMLAGLFAALTRSNMRTGSTAGGPRLQKTVRPPMRTGFIARPGSIIRPVGARLPMSTNSGWYTDCRRR
jgi:general secretion pathway protein K